MKILGTGLNGLIGSRIVELLGEKYEFINISRSTGVDITDKEKVKQAIIPSDASILLHLAAKTDVDGCENDKVLAESGEAWKLNVSATKYILSACENSNKKLIYISTDFVFDGDNPPPGGYDEESEKQPVNWYGMTKHTAEELVKASGVPYLIVRPAYPYGISSAKKRDFVQSILSVMQSGPSIMAITDQLFTPTYIDDIANALDVLIQTNQTGTFHVVGSQSLSPYDAISMIANTFGFPQLVIEKTTRERVYQGRAPRPYNLMLKNDKIKALGITMRSFEDGIREVRNQIFSK